MDSLENRVVFDVVVLVVEGGELHLDLLLLLFQLFESLCADVGVIIGSEHFLDLVEKLQGNSLAVLSIGTLYLL